MMKTLIKFLKDDDGVTSIEYSLIAVAIAAVIALVVFAVGTQLNNTFQSVNATILTGS